MTCDKNTYASKRQAISVALSASRKRGTALRIYFCRDCKGFHLTSKPKGRRADA